MPKRPADETRAAHAPFARNAAPRMGITPMAQDVLGAYA
jgi:hypothetical protein